LHVFGNIFTARYIVRLSVRLLRSGIVITYVGIFANNFTAE